jgi:NADPH-dependent ferric siderophore reductase
VAAVRELTPNFRRVTFAAEDFAFFGTDGLDQRIKILFPLANGGFTDIGADTEWYTRWRALPEHLRNPFRTYTVRAVRRDDREVDVDFVSHPGVGADGPAARWLATATEGDDVVIVGPDGRSLGSAVGIDFHPGTATEILLAGDETSTPAICGILESLPAGVHARAFVEVPTAADAVEVRSDAAIEITWIARDRDGAALDAAVRAWVAGNASLLRPALATHRQELADVDVDRELIWDAPLAVSGEFYAWIAGESAVIKGIRRMLVTETGIDRARVAFMGYWRRGKAESQ